MRSPWILLYERIWFPFLDNLQRIQIPATRRWDSSFCEGNVLGRVWLTESKQLKQSLNPKSSGSCFLSFCPHGHALLFRHCLYLRVAQTAFYCYTPAGAEVFSSSVWRIDNVLSVCLQNSVCRSTKPCVYVPPYVLKGLKSFRRDTHRIQHIPVWRASSRGV